MSFRGIFFSTTGSLGRTIPFGINSFLLEKIGKFPSNDDFRWSGVRSDGRGDLCGAAWFTRKEDSR